MRSWLLVVIAALAWSGADPTTRAGAHVHVPGWEDVYRPLAVRGNADAQYLLALRYLEGDGGEPDYEQAVAWFRVAARQGYVDAMTALATLYDRGEGVEQSDSEAASWLLKAAELGDSEARGGWGLITIPVEAFPRTIVRPPGGCIRLRTTGRQKLRPC